MIVVDASAAVTMFLRLGRVEMVHVPHLFAIEVLHALRRHSLRGDLSAEQSWLIMDLLHEMKAVRYPHAPLAEALDAPLVTMDARLAQAPGIHATVEVHG